MDICTHASIYACTQLLVSELILVAKGLHRQYVHVAIVERWVNMIEAPRSAPRAPGLAVLDPKRDRNFGVPLQGLALHMCIRVFKSLHTHKVMYQTARRQEKLKNIK